MSDRQERAITPKAALLECVARDAGFRRSRRGQTHEMDGSAATHIPHFDLPASTGQDLSLDSFLEKVPLAIVFLSDLEGDRPLVEKLNNALPEFGQQRAQLLAVAPASADEVRRFVEDNDFVMPILADAEEAMSHDFGARDPNGGVLRLGVVATAEGRLVSRLDVLSESDAVERLLTEVRDLHLGADIEPRED